MAAGAGHVALRTQSDRRRHENAIKVSLRVKGGPRHRCRDKIRFPPDSDQITDIHTSATGHGTKSLRSKPAA